MKTIKTLLFLALCALLLSLALPALGSGFDDQIPPEIPDQVYTGQEIRPEFTLPDYPSHHILPAI